MNSPLLALTAALGGLLTAMPCAQLREPNLGCTHTCARGRTCVCPLQTAGEAPSTFHRRNISSHCISVLRAQRPNISIIWGEGIPKLSNTGRLHGSPLLPAVKYMNNGCKCLSFCYFVKTEYLASNSSLLLMQQSLWILSELCSAFRLLPLGCNCTGFHWNWDGVQVNI